MVSSRVSPSENGGSMVKAGDRVDSDANTAATNNKRQSGGIATREGSHPAVETDNNDLASSCTKSRDRKHHRRRRHRRGSKDTGGTNDSNGADTTWDTDGEGQEDKFKLLVEFIPYVGLGDATRDNMVRCFGTTLFALRYSPFTQPSRNCLQ